MTKAKQPRKKAQTVLDRFSEKERRGRPGVRTAEIAGRAINMRYQFESSWDRISKPLLSAKTPQEVNAVLTGTYLERDLVPQMARMVLDVINDPKFPKRSKAQISFLSDSLASLGAVTPPSAQQNGRKRKRRIASCAKIFTLSARVATKALLNIASVPDAEPQCRERFRGIFSFEIG
jgi:hypothetical protein